MAILRLLPIFFLLAFIHESAIAQFEDTNFKIQTIASGLDLPNGITFDKDGIGYVWHMKGKVLLLDTLGQMLPSPFLDLSEEVAKWLDNGFLGFTLHPNFPEEPFAYALYVVDMHYYENYGSDEYKPNETIKKTSTFGRISRFTADEAHDYKRIIPDSKRILLGKTPNDGFPILFDSHGIGSLVFGTDGSLLASSGDAASSIDLDVGSNPNSYFSSGLDKGIITEAENVGAFKAQMTSSLAGKIIRIDPERGNGLSGNPYYDETNPFSKSSKIWTLGLRNGFRFTIEPESGSHFINEGNPGRVIAGDVGYESWEEINVVDGPGKNLGWPIYEGMNESDYAVELILNKEIQNPLFNNQNCSEYFNFQDLIVQDNNSDDLSIKNPCSTVENISSEIPHFKHHRPSLAYRNVSDNSNPISLVPVFDNSDNAIFKELSQVVPNSESFEGIASIAGTYYNASSFPNEYFGKYFHLDFSGWIKTIEFGEEGNVKNVSPFYEGGEKLVHISLNPKTGNLYLVRTNGSIQEISYKGNQKPIIEVEHSKLYGPSPLIVEFDVSNSTDDHGGYKFEWDFGNGETAEGDLVESIFLSENLQIQNYDVRLKMIDSLGLESEQSWTVSVNNTPPEVNIVQPIDGSKYPLDGTHLLRLEAEASDNESQDLNYKWNTFLHHEDHFHEDLEFDSKEAYLLTQQVLCSGDVYWYRIVLEVEDEYGLKGRDEVNIYPNCTSKYPAIKILSKAVNEGVEVQILFDGITDEGIIELHRFDDPLTSREIHQFSNGLNNTIKYIDLNPIIGENIYRAKILFNNGDWFFSNFSTAEFPNENALRISPNPTNGIIELEFEKPIEEDLFLEIRNIHGQIVKTSQFTVVPDKKFDTEINLMALATGTYFLLLKNNNSIFVKKLVIIY